MKVTVRVSPFAPLPEVLEFTRRCEAAGFDGIGYLDSQMINRDLWVTMGAAATVTSRIRLVTAVTNPVTRHISVVASAAASVDDLAPGRVEVWIGRGFSAINLGGAARGDDSGPAYSDPRLQAPAGGRVGRVPRHAQPHAQRRPQGADLPRRGRPAHHTPGG